VAHSIVFRPEGKPVMRPQIPPSPTSRFRRLSLAKSTIVARSRWMLVPASSVKRSSPAGTTAGAGGRSESTSRTWYVIGGGSITPNQGPWAAGACARALPARTASKVNAVAAARFISRLLVIPVA
jgi:hypothetical protein